MKDCYKHEHGCSRFGHWFSNHIDEDIPNRPAMKQPIDLGQFQPETHVWVFACENCKRSVTIPNRLLPPFIVLTGLTCTRCGWVVIIEKKEINYERMQNESNNKNSEETSS